MCSPKKEGDQTFTILKFVFARGDATSLLFGFDAGKITGGSAGFVREYAEKVYGIVPEQVAVAEQAFKYGYNKDHRPILTGEPKQTPSA